MSVQRIGEKKLRQAAAVTGLNLKHGIANGGNQYTLTTVDHRHFTYDPVAKRAELVELETHYSSCPDGSTDDGNWS